MIPGATATAVVTGAVVGGGGRRAHGVVYALGTMYWFFGVFAGSAIPLLALMAGYFGLLGLCIGMTRGQSTWVRAATVALFAVGIEWVRGDCWYLCFPWYTAPHALAASPPWIAGCVGWAFTGCRT